MAILLVLLVAASCSDTSSPGIDNIPPVVQFSLLVWPQGAETDVPMSVTFYIDPRACSDNESSIDELQARWDFNLDDEWDTELGPVEPFVYRNPIDLPQGTWEVSCELKDSGGNVSIGTASLELPFWYPQSPDVILGGIRLSLHDAELDSIGVGETIWWHTLRQYWINGDDYVAHFNYFIDGVSIGQESYTPDYCPSHLFCTELNLLQGGIDTPGTYELRVEASLEGEFPESNLDNNSSTRIIRVYE